MSLSATCRHGAQVFRLCGLPLALAIAAGCGHKPAPPTPTPVKAATNAPAANSLANAPTNVANPYVSVFEDLLPPKGKDPFYPTSVRRNPKMVEPVASTTPSAPADPEQDLVLKAIIGTGKHAQAIINHSIFEAGEEPQTLRVPNGHVLVKCTEIGADYVMIQVDGAAPVKLVKGDKKN